jgi:salicylate hydroxylase
MPFSIIIVGGGIAGLATAVRLAQTGHHVKLVERKNINGPVVSGGSGIHLAPNAMRILSRWGLHEDIRWAATESRQTNFRRFDTGEIIRTVKQPANERP